MKCKSIAILIVCVSLAGTVLAQTSNGDDEIGGAGTPNYIAKFLSKHKIGNSNIFQSPAGNVGVGTTTPGFALHVVSATTSGPLGQFPAAMVSEASGTAEFTAAIRAIASGSGTSNLVFGVDGITFNPGGIGVQGNFPLTNAQGGGGVHGLTSATSGFSYGVSGDAIGTTGTAVGVVGQTFSDQGIGVFGNRPNAAASGFGGGGVRGVTSADNFVFTYGTSGVATALTGSAVGIFGQAYSPNGTAGFFANVAGGNILEGGFGQPATTVFRVDGTGRVFADGGLQPSGADFAESMEVTGDRSKYAAGDLLVIDPTANRRVALAQRPYSTLVAGIYSTKPGMLGTTRKVGESAPYNEIPLAVVGIVPCKVTAENGPIQIGDLLVTSSIPGHAMKGTDRNRMLGAVVGKALEPLPQGVGIIQVLVTLQ
jgi:hypothetical protein